MIKKDINKSICELCNVRKATHEHHTIFDITTNKSDKTSPIQNLCALCHAKVHGISPNISELRMLVQEFNRVQKTRIIYDNSMRGFSYIEMKTPEFFQQQSDNLNDYEKVLSKKIKLLLDGSHVPVDNQDENASKQMGETIIAVYNQKPPVFPIYNWLKQIKGISHLLSAQLIAYIDINKFRQVASLWHYCGMHVNNETHQAPKRSKGNKIDWNPTMRMICYKISDSFIKQRTPKYREIYDVEKAKQLILLEETKLFKKTKGSLSKSKSKEVQTNSCVNTIVILSAPQSLGHADNRARRKAVKEFLKDMFLEWKRLETKVNLNSKIAMSPINTQEETIKYLKTNTNMSPLPITNINGGLN